MAQPTGFEPVASASGAATNPRRHDSRRQPALQLPFPGADGIQRETVAAGRRAAEILLAAMPGAAGPEDPRIVGEVWPLELIARESDPGAPAAVDALAPFGSASPRRARQSRLEEEAYHETRGRIDRDAPLRRDSGGLSEPQHLVFNSGALQRSYVPVEILKNESLHAQGRARARRMIFSTPNSLNSTIS